MGSPAGIGYVNQDGTIQYIIISDDGWIKNGIGILLYQDYQSKRHAKKLISGDLPNNFYPLLGQWPMIASNRTAFLRALFFRPRCMVCYAYLWENNEWWFCRLDGSEMIPLFLAITKGIED